jgi:two-component system chemotaxis response regulator CheB
MSLNLVLLGISTGGPKTLRRLVPNLGRLNAAVLLVQHMPKFINVSVCKTLAASSQMDIYLASDGQKLQAGGFYVAPSEVHMSLSGNNTIKLQTGPKVCFVCPSVDVMMQSVNRQASKVIGVVMTGMGKDGAQGLAHLKSIGAETIAQDEESSVIWGMPGAAVEMGVADHVLSPERIAEYLRNTVGLLSNAA